MFKLKKVVKNFIFFLFFLIKPIYAIELYRDESNNLITYNQLFKKKLLKYDFKEFNYPMMLYSGLKFETKINDSFTLLNNFCNEFFINSFKDNKNKYYISKLIIGYFELIHKKYGSISFGRNYGLIQDILNVSDISPCFNNKANKFDYFMFNKANNVVTYRSLNLIDSNDRSIKLNLQFQGNNNISEHRKKFIGSSNGYGIGTSIICDINKNFNISGAYFKSKRSPSQLNIEVDSNPLYNKNYACAYALSSKFNNNNMYMSILYSRNYFITSYGRLNNEYMRKIFEDKSALSKYHYYGFAKRTDNFEIVSKYKSKFKINPFIGYIHTVLRDVKGLDEYLNKFIGIGVSYEPSKNLSMFIDYKINFIEENNFIRSIELDTDNTLAYGFSYKF